MADAVEKLKSCSLVPFFWGGIPEIAIVEYRAIVEVDFLSALQPSRNTEFFNTIGRMHEFASDCFADTKLTDPVLARAATLEQPKGAFGVGNTCSPDRKAAVQGHRRLKGSLPPGCSPTKTYLPRAGMAELRE